ncbi:AMP-binding protein [Bacillus sp. B-TM1]
MEWRAHTFRITENDIISQFYSHSFDSSVSEIFSALLTGARLYLLNEEQRFSTHAYCKAISTNRITITDVATAFFNQLATELSDTQIQQIQFLRVLSMGGEAVKEQTVYELPLVAAYLAFHCYFVRLYCFLSFLENKHTQRQSEDLLYVAN